MKVFQLQQQKKKNQTLTSGEEIELQSALENVMEIIKVQTSKHHQIKDKIIKVRTRHH